MKRYAPTFIILFFGLFILYMNACYHFSSDDCYYALQWLSSEDVLPRHQSIITAFKENCADGYRPIPHLFVRIFCGCFPKVVFNVANTAMLLGLILFVLRYATGGWNFPLDKIVLAIGSVYVFLCKGESYLWCAGSLNYLWVAVPTIGFLIVREKIERNELGKLQILFAAVFAFFCGWLQEACVLPVCFAICVSCLLSIKNLTSKKVVVYGAYGLGALLLLYSTIGRAVSQGGVAHSILDVAINLVKIFWAIKIVWLVLLLLLLSQNRIAFIEDNKFEMLIILGSILMISIIGFTGERSLYAANLLGVVILVKCLNMPRWGTVVASFSMLGLMALLSLYAYRVYANFENCLGLYLESPDGVTIHERVDCGIFSRFFHQVVYGWQQEGHNLSFSMFYGDGKPLYALSKFMYENLYLKDNFCTEENKLPIDGEYYTIEGENAIVMPCLMCGNIDPISHNVNIIYDLPKSLRERLSYEIALRKNPPIAHQERFSRLHTFHGDYFLLVKQPFCGNRISGVSFCPINIKCE